MGRAFRGDPVRFLGACALSGALLASPAAASATPDPLTVSKQVTVSASGVTAVTLTCPGKSFAASGYVTRLSAGALSRASIPTDVRRWRFEFSSAGGTEGARVGLRCLRLKLAPGLHRVRTKAFSGRTTVPVPASSSTTARSSCPSGYLPTGYGIDRSAAPRSLQLASAVPSSRSWSFRVKNSGASEQSATLRVRCIGARATATRSGRTVSQRFSIARPAFSDTVSGRGALAHRCGPGSTSLAAGHVVSARDDIEMNLHFAAGARSGGWEVQNRSGRDQRVRTYLTCLSLRTRFR